MPNPVQKISHFIRTIIQGSKLDYFIPFVTSELHYSLWVHSIVPLHTQYKNDSFRKCRRNGIEYNLNLSDLMDWYVYFGFKENEKNNFYRTLKNGSSVFDIGANLGQITLNAAKLSGKSGIVFSFEPDKNNHRKLQDNLTLNSFTNIRTFQTALGEKSGKGSMVVIDEQNKGMNKVEESSLGDTEIISLDEFVMIHKIETITHLKIDTEGFEMKILRGGIQSLKKFHPLLLIEIDDNNLKAQQSSATEAIQFIYELGYNIRFAGNMEKVNTNSDFKNCHFDIICI